jgi:asparagine synthase (glutamine-hydrolysing)
MCGIVGIYSKRGLLEESKTLAFLNKSVESMKHRGPDSQKSVFVNNFYGSGFARLAIRDLSENAMQPMHSKCGNYIISFNGEIYNTDYLKTKLIDFNVKYETTSDTEVLLYSLINFGIDKTLEEIDGIFAFSFYNIKDNILILARDRVGIKPLYYYYDKDLLIYSSHYNQVVKNDFVKNKEIDEVSFSAYFNLGYVPSGFGFFKNSFLLPQGCYIIVNNNSFKKNIKYYEYGNEIKFDVNLEKTIKDSIKSQLVSDVPIGTFLSGGIDSSIVSYIANNETKIQAFNIGFNDNDFDESAKAIEFAKHNSIDINSKVFDSINLNYLLEHNIKAFSEPFSDYSSLPTLLLSEFAKKSVTVSLSGDGGDELFYGYYRNSKYFAEMDTLINSKFKKFFIIFISKITNKKHRIPLSDLLLNANEALLQSNYITGIKIHGKRMLKKYYSNIYFDFLDNRKNQIKTKKGFLDTMRKYDIYYHLQRVLIKVDRTSMFHSLEVRVPLLSNKIIDLSQKYEYHDCLIERKGKQPLRNIISKYDNGILSDLPKKGFSLPLDEMINSREFEIISKYILIRIPQIDKLLNYDYIVELYMKHINKEGDYKSTSWLLWSVFTLKSWYKFHIDDV